MAVKELSQLKVRSPFCDLFPIDPRIQAAIKENMERHGFDASKPIDVWRDWDVVIDGHTRLSAAKAAGLVHVETFEHHFTSEEQALEYAIRNQRDRRNMTDADIARCVVALDKRKPEGRPDKTSRTQLVSANGASRDHTAAVVGTSPFKVQQVRTVLDHADEPIKQAVLSGEMSINSAYNHTQEQRKAAPQPSSKPTFNRTNDNIEWALWTWNPVTGCKHGCRYCYARDIANRFYSEGFEPKYHPERLSAPHNTKVPDTAKNNIGERNVFVCSMADLFGEWVPQEWIDAVLSEVRKNPQWTFIFLTKNPKRMVGIDWPLNARVGTTVDVQARVKGAEEAFASIKAPVKFLSCEPLSERLTFTRLEVFDWVIVGGRSRTTAVPELQPPWEWVEHLLWQARANYCKWYMKPNLTARAREYPANM